MQVTFVQWNCQTIGSTSQHCFIPSLNHNLGGLVDLCWHSSMLRASARCPHKRARKRGFANGCRATLGENMWHKGTGDDQVSWYRPRLETSLALIERAATNRSAAIIDGGGGPSILVDDLIGRGYDNVTAGTLSTLSM